MPSTEERMIETIGIIENLARGAAARIENCTIEVAQSAKAASRKVGAAAEGSGAAKWIALRDEFAKAALTGLLAADTDSSPCVSDTKEGQEKERREYAVAIANSAFRFADAMLAERARTPEETKTP